MFQLEIYIGLGFALVAAAVAIYNYTTVSSAHHRMQSNNPSINRMQSSNRSIVRPERNREIQLSNSNPGDSCAICLQIMHIQTIKKLSCGHAVHSFPCYDDWFAINSRCPYCYAEIQY